MEENVLSFIKNRRIKFAHRVALAVRSYLGWNEITFRGLNILSERLASYLIDSGIQHNDKIAILSESMPEFGAVLFANFYTGATSVPLDVKSTYFELKNIISDFKPKVILSSKTYFDKALKLKNEIPSIKDIVIIDGKGTNKDFANLYSLPDKKDRKWNNIGLDDTALIIYTSGTTGNPKGVEITYKNIISQVLAINKCFDFNYKDNMLSILPMNHLFEISVGFMTFLYNGASIYYSQSLNPKDIFEITEEKNITYMVAVPAFLKLIKMMIEKEIKKYKYFEKFYHNFKYFISNLLSSRIVSRFLFKKVRNILGPNFKAFICGGAPLEYDIAKFFENIGIRIYDGYGLSEASPIVSINKEKNRKTNSVGKSIEGTEVKIDENTCELLVKGVNVMKGYYNRPDLTKEVITSDGWLKTGDIATIDSKGYIYITGRLKNMIVLSGGKKVFPEEIEAVLSKSEIINEVLVYSKIIKEGSKKGTEEICAKIYPSKELFEQYSNIKDVEEIINSEVKTLSLDLSSYKRPNRVIISKEPLEKTGILKISRKNNK